MAAARATGPLSECATRIAVVTNPRRDPRKAGIICGRAASSSPKNPASTKFSAVPPAKCSSEEDSGLIVLAQAHRLGDPHRQQRGAQAVLQRLAHREVGGQ
jgi:hypothetical protein